MHVFFCHEQNRGFCGHIGNNIVNGSKKMHWRDNCNTISISYYIKDMTNTSVSGPRLVCRARKMLLWLVVQRKRGWGILSTKSRKRTLWVRVGQNTLHIFFATNVRWSGTKLCRNVEEHARHPCAKSRARRSEFKVMIADATCVFVSGFGF